MMNRSLQQ